MRNNKKKGKREIGRICEDRMERHKQTIGKRGSDEKIK